MPNVLVHYGVQGPASRGLVSGAALKWVFLGCILPDVPWILQRVVRVVAPATDPYALRLYCIAQASLVVTLLLCGAVALLARGPLPVFAVLAGNSVLHLVLDALETKWANGVHLFAPFSWKMWNAGLVWPENVVVTSLTVAGLCYAFWSWLRHPPSASRPTRRRRRWAGAGVLIGLYLLAPLGLRDGPAAADNHFVATLRAEEARPGRYVEFDRNPYLHRPDGSFIVSFAGDTLRLRGELPDRSGTASLRGVFVDARTVRVREVRLHRTWFRDGASYLGLLFLLALWIRSWSRRPDPPREARPAGDLATDRPDPYLPA